MASDYVYDVFISYRRKQPVMDWMRLHFFPLLEVILPECMPRAPRIFIDWETETGAEWPARLAQALATSRCLLPVWSPQYFRSPCCLAELRTMMDRERTLGLRTPERPTGLIFPVRFADGDHFPLEVKRIQDRDLRRWNTMFECFQQTREVLEFEREVYGLCTALWQMISTAPEVCDDWPVVQPESFVDRISQTPQSVALPRF